MSVCVLGFFFFLPQGKGGISYPEIFSADTSQSLRIWSSPSHQLSHISFGEHTEAATQKCSLNHPVNSQGDIELGPEQCLNMALQSLREIKDILHIQV